MSVRYFGPDPATSRLRLIVTMLGKRIARTSTQGLDEIHARKLQAAFDVLSKHLALGPEPLVRACPQCGTIGMRAATICGQCWSRLDALEAPQPLA
jgi:hypothetical protein